MNIAILGAGAMAKGLAIQFSRSGYNVVLGARDRNKAADAAADIGRGVQAASFRGAASAADIIILATPYAAASDVLGLAGDLNGKIIIDITNPMTPDFSGLAIGHTSSAAEEIQESRARCAGGESVQHDFRASADPAQARRETADRVLRGRQRRSE
ncbi:MAG: NAD(P)-binding domain-containing protein [Terricaulis sp.]|nr:NAD(P)-binding domain-containing protein [Terricaulis sp.]